MATLFLAWLTFVAFLSAIPMYSDAANQFVLGKELASETARAPSFAFYFHQVGAASEAVDSSSYVALNRFMSDGVELHLDIPRRTQMHYVSSDTFRLYPSDADPRTSDVLHVKLGTIENLAKVIELVEGYFPVPTASTSLLEILVSRSLADETGLSIGDEFILFRSDLDLPSATSGSFESPTGVDKGIPRPSGATNGVDSADRRVQLRVRVAGVWAPRFIESDVWYLSPSAFDQTFLTPMESYLSLAESGTVPDLLYNLGFYDVYDGSSIRAEDASVFLRQVRALEMRLQMLAPGIALEISPVSALLRYQRAATSQTLKLFGFLVPFIGLILYFMVGISRSTIDRQRFEIAIFRSRGASSRQISGLYVLQAVLMGFVAMMVGPLLGRLMAQALGISYSFLHFEDSPLTVTITRNSRFCAAAGAMVAGLATVLPALSASRMMIVEANRELARPMARPLWERSGLDVILLAAALYGYYLLRGQGRLAILTSGSTQSPLANPLLFLAPALFIGAMALVFMRVFPIVPASLSWIGGWLRGVTALLAFRSLQRDGRGYASLLLLLVMGTSLAAYTASAAETLDHNSASRIRYGVGADLVLKEGAGVVLPADSNDVSGGDSLRVAQSAPRGWTILPIEYHLRARGVQAVTPVVKLPARVGLGGDLVEGIYFGIDRTSFPQVAYFRPDFSPEPLGALMNSLAREPSGLLVSRAVLARTGLTIGDPLPLAGLIPLTNQTLSFRIIGIVDYFPTVYPEDGEIFVGNMEYLFQEIGGKRPYDVWVSQQDGSDTLTLLGDLYESGLRVISYEDAQALIREEQLKPERTGVFGFLSIGFLITIGLCALAQLIYALVSFRRRSIQFGALRALGMSRETVALSLTYELGLIVIAGIATGILLGLVTSYMFIPLLQIGYRAADLFPPFEVLIAWPKVIIVILVLTLTSVAVNGAIVARLVRIEMSEVLKLGGTAA